MMNDIINLILGYVIGAVVALLAVWYHPPTYAYHLSKTEWECTTIDARDDSCVTYGLKDRE